MLRLAVVCLSLLLAACVGQRQAPPPGPVQLSVVFTGNLDGELEPCGCSEAGNLGGIKRQVAMLDRLRETDPDLVLLSSGGLIESQMPQDRIKAEFILRGLAEARYDAIGIQWKDLAYGVDFLTAHPLPWVASNWRGDDFPRQRTIRRAGVELVFFQWLDPKRDPQKTMAGPGRVSDDPAPLLAALKAAKARGAITILGSTLPLPLWQKRPPFPLDDVDLLIQRARYEEYGEPARLGRTWVVQPGSRGMRLGKLDLTLEHGTIAHLSQTVIPLPKAVGEAERLEGWYDAYNAAVKADYERRVALRARQRTAQGPYAGEATCKTCHPKEHARWRETAHANAFYTLQDVNKAFDPECLACHTVGFERDGGFIDPQLTPGLEHVQCENCHGPARAHADSGGATPTPHRGWPRAQVCAQCHVHEHSPEFDLRVYWPHIAHGGTR